MVTEITDCPMQKELLKDCKDRKSSKIVSKKSMGYDSKYEQAALMIAKLVAKKQIQYGNSFGNSDKIFKVLYPNGVSPEQMKDFLVIVRIVDKLFRIARGDQGEESAWADINGYSLLALTRNERND
jgi:hypothetical protein